MGFPSLHPDQTLRDLVEYPGQTVHRQVELVMVVEIAVVAVAVVMMAVSQ